jgi:hypothetical protein
VQYEPDKLLEKIEENMKKLEEIAVAIFHKVSTQVRGKVQNMKADPYKITLATGVDTSSDNAIAPRQSIIDDVNKFWFYKEEYA